VRRNSKHKITRERLSQALETLAIVVDAYGDAYWPLFDAVKSVLERENVKSAELNRYLPKGRSIPKAKKTSLQNLNVIPLNGEEWPSENANEEPSQA